MSNASLLDEATAAAEAMTMCSAVARGKKTKFLVRRQSRLVCVPRADALLHARAGVGAVPPADDRGVQVSRRRPRPAACGWQPREVRLQVRLKRSADTASIALTSPPVRAAATTCAAC